MCSVHVHVLVTDFDMCYMYIHYYIELLYNKSSIDIITIVERLPDGTLYMQYLGKNIGVLPW